MLRISWAAFMSIRCSCQPTQQILRAALLVAEAALGGCSAGYAVQQKARRGFLEDAVELLELAVSGIFEGLRWVTQKLLLLPPPEDACVPVVPVGKGSGPLAAVRSALCRTQHCVKPFSCRPSCCSASLLQAGCMAA